MLGLGFAAASKQIVTLASLAVAVAAFALPGAARADTWVWALPGQVTVSTDDAAQRLQIYDSDVDTASKTIPLTGTGNLYEFKLAQGRAMREWSDLAQGHAIADPNITDPSASKLAAETAAVLGSITNVPPNLQPKVAELRQVFERAIDLAKRAHALERDLDLVYPDYQGMISRGVSKDEALRQVDSWFRDSTARLAQARREATVAAEEVRRVRAEIRAAWVTAPKPVQDAISRLSRRLMGRLINASEAGFATLRFMRFIAGAALFADAAHTVYSMFAAHTVVIRNLGSSPMRAVWPCRGMVRGSSGQLQNAVSCPAPRSPAALGSLFGLTPASGLYVNSGNGNDSVDLSGLTPAANHFDEITVETGPGNDSVLGSPFDDHLYGGPGNDELAGKDGDDDLRGDLTPFPIGANPASSHDRLFGGSGKDVVYGDLGDDLVMGGSGDDDSWIGAALSGGPGNDTVVGGPGRDSMEGGEGRDAIFAKESDFTVNASTSVKQRDEIDYVVDCGDASQEHATVSAGEDVEGYPEVAGGCTTTPAFIPSLGSLVLAQPSGGRWPWFR